MLDFENKADRLLAGLIGWVIGYVFGLLYVTNVIEPLRGGLLK